MSWLSKAGSAWLGCRLMPGIDGIRSGEISFDVPIARETGSLKEFIKLGADRTVTITLTPGQRWPSAYRKGQAITLRIEVDSTHYGDLVGRVKYRRLGKMVVLGRIELVGYGHHHA